MRRLRALLLALGLSVTGSAYAYDSFTIGLQGELTPVSSGFNAHAVLPVTRFEFGANPAVLSLRADFTAGIVPYGGLSAVMSILSSNVQPFVAVGGGAILPGGPPLRPAFRGLLGLRVHLVHDVYMVGHLQIRAFSGGAVPGVSIGVEYSF